VLIVVIFLNDILPNVVRLLDQNIFISNPKLRMRLLVELVIGVPDSKYGVTLFSPVLDVIVNKWTAPITDSIPTKSVEDPKTDVQVKSV